MWCSLTWSYIERLDEIYKDVILQAGIHIRAIALRGGCLVEHLLDDR